MRSTTASYHHQNIKEKKKSTTALSVYFHFPSYYSMCVFTGDGMVFAMLSSTRTRSRFNNIDTFTYFSF